jgi:hypothetical protein
MEYRIDQLDPQQTICYLHGVASVTAAADIIFFIGYQGEIIATIPVPSRTAYVQL